MESAIQIIYGDYEEHYHESNEIYCYERNFNGQKALIVCSFADHTITFRAPKGFDLTKGEVLISNYHDAPAKKDICALRPYEARVYLYK